MRSVAIASLAWVCALGGCCDDAPCHSGLFWGAPLPGIDASTVDGLTIRACRNGACASGALVAHPVQRLSQATLVAETMDAAPTGQAQAYPDAYGTFTVHVAVFAGTTTLVDGDMYRIDVLDRSGTTVVSLPEESVTYAQDHPNGPDCPGSCVVAYRGTP